MQSKTIPQTRTLTFPSSHDQVEILTFKNIDGSFKHAEVVVPLLKKAFLQVNETIVGSHVINPDAVTFYRILSPSKIQIFEFNTVPGTNKIDFSTENLLFTLPPSDVDKVGHFAISSIVTFFELFSHYYTVKSSRDNGLHSVLNDDLVTLLRFSDGAKIKYLDTLLSLYLALNGQTYFDVACHAMISGAYTFGSLFSITGLYYAANSKLNGRTMLVDAQKRSFMEDHGTRDRGEIHTKQGLTVLYYRQFRLRPKREVQPKKDRVYEPMVMIEEEPYVSDMSNKSLTSDASFRRVYEQVREYKLLSLTGLQELESYQHEFLDIINRNSVIRERIKKDVKVSNISSLIHVLSILDDSGFVDLFKKMDIHLMHTYDRMIINRVLEIDLFGGSTYKELFNRNLIRFLALIESTPLESDLTNSIIKRFQLASDCTDVVLDLIDEFLEIIG